MADTQALLQRAIAHHEAGQLQQAESFYRQVLQINPNQPDALHLLGVLAAQVGQPAIAIELIGKALAINPSMAAAHSNLGNALRDSGQLDRAIAAYRESLRLAPQNADAHNNLGTVLRDQGNLDAAVASFRAAVALNPNHASAHNNLAVTLRDLGALPEAIASFEQAARLIPNSPQIQLNLALAYQAAERLEDAVVAVNRCIQLTPNDASAHAVLGQNLINLARHADAVAPLQEAVRLKPDFAEAYRLLGEALGNQQKLDDAIDAYRRAIQINPNNAVVHRLLGDAYFNLTRLEEAIASFDRAIELTPEDPGPLSARIFAMMFDSRFTQTDIRDKAIEFDRVHGLPRREHILPFENDPDPQRRLRIGYVSRSFSAHVQSLFTVPLMRNHNRQNVEVFCYSGVNRPDQFTEQTRGGADVWWDVSELPDARIAARIRRDKIDILVDLTMHMADNCLTLFARKPAPIQVAWFAYPGTTGLSAIDYRFTDPYLDPPGMYDADYSEKSYRLRDTFWCIDSLQPDPDVGPLPALANGYVTFGNLNNFLKISNESVLAWSRVMQRVPGSKFLLLAPEGSGRERVRSVARDVGINPDRFEFVGRQTRGKYLATYNRIDIGLDSFPYNGHTTSIDSYWMGVPVVTRVGKTLVGRAGFSQLSNLRMTELAGADVDQFVEIAANLAGDLPRLSQLRADLRERTVRSPLMDTKRFAESMELAYRDIWRKWCDDRNGRS